MKTLHLVWDFPTRVFHWLLALSFAGAYITAETERYRDIHLALGYIFLGLIVFRLVWGFAGSRYARFSSFTFSPKQVFSYVKSLFSGYPEHYVGHNPAGAWAIFILIGLGVVISVSGMGLDLEFGDEDFFEELHELGANLMLAVVFIHIAGVVISSLLHKENLPRAMVTGYKPTDDNQGITQGYPIVGAVLLVACMAFLVIYLSLG